jgi:hypothetical protein
MSAAEGNVNIPENSNLTTLLNQLLSELWKAGRIDRAAIDRILEAGKKGRLNPIFFSGLC